jgi:hypothetical protein
MIKNMHGSRVRLVCNLGLVESASGKIRAHACDSIGLSGVTSKVNNARSGVGTGPAANRCLVFWERCG